MNKANDFLMIGSYICGLNSKLFLHTDKTFFCVLERLYINAEKQLHLILNQFMFVIFTSI